MPQDGKSEYHDEVMSIGLAPDDIPGLLKQRGTWAVDNWRLFLFKNALFMPGKLTWRQRLQYFELGIFHMATSFFTPLIMIVPVISLLTGQYLPIEGAALFPWFISTTFVYYLVLSNGRGTEVIRMWQFWVGHGPTYLKAFTIAVRSRHKKPSYVVTRKTRQHGFYGLMLWPQFAYLIVVGLVLIRVLLGTPPMPQSVFVTNVTTMLFFAFMMSAICRAAFYGFSREHLKRLFTITLPKKPRRQVGQWNNLPGRIVSSGED